MTTSNQGQLVGGIAGGLASCLLASLSLRCCSSWESSPWRRRMLSIELLNESMTWRADTRWGGGGIEAAPSNGAAARRARMPSSERATPNPHLVQLVADGLAAELCRRVPGGL